MKALPMIAFRRLSLLLAGLVLSSPALASAELARSKNCIACHHAERRMIGPAFNLIANRYANDSDAVETLTARIIAGSGGNWGPTPMPAQPTLSREDAEALIRWILSPR
jgi:cytochrome c